MDHKVKFPFLQNESACLPGGILVVPESSGRQRKQRWSFFFWPECQIWPKIRKEDSVFIQPLSGNLDCNLQRSSLLDSNAWPTSPSKWTITFDSCVQLDLVQIKGSRVPNVKLLLGCCCFLSFHHTPNQPCQFKALGGRGKQETTGPLTSHPAGAKITGGGKTAGTKASRGLEPWVWGRENYLVLAGWSREW